MTHTTEHDTFITCRVDKRKNNDNTYKKIEKYASGSKKSNSAFFCEHCKVHGHTIDLCWKVHGYPRGFKRNSWKKEGQNVSMANGVSSDIAHRQCKSKTHEWTDQPVVESVEQKAS